MNDIFKHINPYQKYIQLYNKFIHLYNVKLLCIIAIIAVCSATPIWAGYTQYEVIIPTDVLNSMYAPHYTVEFAEFFKEADFIPSADRKTYTIKVVISTDIKDYLKNTVATFSSKIKIKEIKTTDVKPTPTPVIKPTPNLTPQPLPPWQVNE